MTEEFAVHLDGGMLEYFRDIAHEMVARFGISYAEAVARINERYEGAEISPYPDLMCHESAAFWAFGLYYFPDASGRLPSGDEDDDEGLDMSTLRVRPAPPGGSRFWPRG
ncbi:hypothetical protein ELQ87_16495 [Streptomyces griseoviridis]|uniref:Uncharacterized protein n=1 Tax=Streptomyces griseoviridis TaxID=45398 RepID=A0A3Q9KNW7_STRGD|nr:hypothetical protein [Streptomyces griseoviridis]AZS85722.1 hypothetical protein ELQ87_16495 [Streptomyces griseoviridis]QCN87428.1 hypothetical protein DDJ31_22790 [Streptomyces griseoviridis]